MGTEIFVAGTSSLSSGYPALFRFFLDFLPFFEVVNSENSSASCGVWVPGTSVCSSSSSRSLARSSASLSRRFCSFLLSFFVKANSSTSLPSSPCDFEVSGSSTMAWRPTSPASSSSSSRSRAWFAASFSSLFCSFLLSFLVKANSSASLNSSSCGSWSQASGSSTARLFAASASSNSLS